MGSLETGPLARWLGSRDRAVDMDKLSRARRGMVYPERINMDSVLKESMSPIGSWCEVSSTSDDVISLSTPHPGAAVLSLESLTGDELNFSCSSRGHDSPVSTIYRPTSASRSSRLDVGDSNSFILARLRRLVQLFQARAHKFKRRLELPPTPSTTRSERGAGQPAPPPPPPLMVTSWESPEQEKVPRMRKLWTRIRKLKYPRYVIDPEGYGYATWLCLVTLCFLYNAVVIPMRSSFPYQTADNTFLWFIVDYICDAVYLVDIVFVKPRLKFLDEGFWIDIPELTLENYQHKLQFKLDILSLLPLDLFYLLVGTSHVALRLPRILKTFNDLYGRLDSLLPSPYIVRVGRTILYMLYMIHCNACAFYAFSAWEGLASNGWVFNGVGNAYIRCFFFSTKTATSIGKNAKPENNIELVFMTWNWLQGVFVFALLISQMRDIVASATGVQNEYRQIVDGTLEYMRRQNLPLELQERVKRWFTFTWTQQRTLDERQITGNLPNKLKMDVALNLHIQTLNKVQLFKDCDEALLRELVLKLRPVIFLPMDLVIRKGDVGKEMYIVKTGQVQVMGGNEVLATLSEGSVFGEIALLGDQGGGNRRTATVRSRGFSNIFVLNKADLEEAIEHYPAAQKILHEKAQALVRANTARVQEVVETEDEYDRWLDGGVTSSPQQTTPKLLHTVLQVVPADSGTARLLRRPARRHRAPRRSSQPRRVVSSPQIQRSDSSSDQLQCEVIVHQPG